MINKKDNIQYVWAENLDEIIVKNARILMRWRDHNGSIDITMINICIFTII